MLAFALTDHEGQVARCTLSHQYFKLASLLGRHERRAGQHRGQHTVGSCVAPSRSGVGCPCHLLTSADRHPQTTDREPFEAESRSRRRRCEVRVVFAARNEKG